MLAPYCALCILHPAVCNSQAFRQFNIAMHITSPVHIAQVPSQGHLPLGRLSEPPPLLPRPQTAPDTSQPAQRQHRKHSTRSRQHSMHNRQHSQRQEMSRRTVCSPACTRRRAARVPCDDWTWPHRRSCSARTCCATRLASPASAASAGELVLENHVWPSCPTPCGFSCRQAELNCRCLATADSEHSSVDLEGG